MNHLNYIIQPIIVLISLFGIFIGIIVSIKCSGKLKVSMILIVTSIIIIFVYNFLGIMGLTGNAITENLYIKDIIQTNNSVKFIHLIFVLFLTISLLLMKKIVEGEDKNTGRKRR